MIVETCKVDVPRPLQSNRNLFCPNFA